MEVQDYISDTVCVSFGVPRGSVIGPILFALYTAPLGQFVADDDVEHHLYADDTQSYASLSGSEALESLVYLESCAHVFAGMTISKLDLNPSGTEFIIVDSGKKREVFMDLFPMLLLGRGTLPRAFVGNLGFIFYCDFNFGRRVSQTCRVCFCRVRDFRRVGRYHIGPETAGSVACALVASHLDYCGSLLRSLPVVCKASRFSRYKPVLNFLHWLPVRCRIRFRLCAIAFMALLSRRAACLFGCLVPFQNSRLLRSSNPIVLTVPRYQTKWGSRALQLQLPPLGIHCRLI